MSVGVASVTAAMHGSNSTSSLESLEQLNASPFSDEDEGGSFHSIDIQQEAQSVQGAAGFVSSHPSVLVSNADSDDSDDDDSDDSERKSSAAVIQLTQLTSAAERSKRRASASASVSSRSSACFSIALLDSDDRPLCLLPPEQEDIFSLESFCSLHQQRRAQGKQLIIAQVSTRDKNCTRLNSTVSSYYDALPLLRVLFRIQHSEQRGAAAAAAGGVSVRHRYHQYQTVTPVNPLTATCIIGDVRFFMTDAVDGPNAAASPFPPSPSASSRSSAACSEVVNARYIGSDYNFAFSPSFRALFFPHALSSAPAASPASPSIAPTPTAASPASASSPLSPSSPASDSSSPSGKDGDFLLLLDELLRQPQKPRARALGWVGQQAEQLHALVSGSPGGGAGTVDWPEYVAVPFPRAVAYGTVLSLYGLLSFLIFEQSMMEAINGVQSDSLQLDSMWWYLALPPLMIIVDCMTATLFRTRERLLLWLLKAALFAVYYTGPLVILTGEELSINLGRRLLQMLMPVLFVLYSILFFFWHWRTTRLE